MRVLARRTYSGPLPTLVPADDQAVAEFRRVPDEKLVYVEVVAARNPKQHRLLFGLLGKVVEDGMFPSTEAALIALKFATGLVDSIVIDRRGEVRLVPRSIDWAQMKQTEFAAWFEGAVNVVVERWLPNVSSDALRKEIEEMVGA